MDEDLKTYLEAMESRLREHTETVETRLLLEFWKWARQADARYRRHHSAVTGLDERLNAGRGPYYSRRAINRKSGTYKVLQKA